MAAEAAVGINHSIASKVDWSVHSQMNEGVGGTVHFAVGNGQDGIHLDMIREAQLVD